MLQEDSNAETFEIIDKKSEEITIPDSSGDKMTSSPSVAPLSGPPSVNTQVSGNMLSNIQPPSALPSFISPSPVVQIPMPSITKSKEVADVETIPQSDVSPSNFNIPTPTTETFYPTQFSAAIPPSKGVQHGIQHIPVESPDAGGFMDWMRGAVSSGGILSKVAEKAKNSVDSMITTLDPQMKEFIYTGGDLGILVASEQEVKVSAIREAFQTVFGKARVDGIEAHATTIAAQPVGFVAGIKAAEERIEAVLKNPKVTDPLPVVAIENFILEVSEDKWYDLGVIILTDPIKQIQLQTFTQMVPVPPEIVALAQEDTPADYPLRWSGLAVPIGKLMGSNLHVHHKEWHQALTGVSRREIILSSAKVLANLYKNSTGGST